MLHSAQTLLYAAPTVWNTLPFNVQTADTLGQFRTSLHTHTQLVWAYKNSEYLV